MEKKPLRSAGAFWVKQTEGGGQYMSFSFETDIKKGDKVFALPNKYKKEPKHPDFKLFFNDDEPAVKSVT